MTQCASCPRDRAMWASGPMTRACDAYPGRPNSKLGQIVTNVVSSAALQHGAYYTGVRCVNGDNCINDTLACKVLIITVVRTATTDPIFPHYNRSPAPPSCKHGAPHITPCCIVSPYHSPPYAALFHHRTYTRETQCVVEIDQPLQKCAHTQRLGLQALCVIRFQNVFFYEMFFGNNSWLHGTICMCVHRYG